MRRAANLALPLCAWIVSAMAMAQTSTLAELDRYNIVWKTPSKNAAGSMPIGNGEVGLNVWVEESVHLSEPWAAWIDAQGQGLGIFFPHTNIATTYRVRDGGAGDCSYLAPIEAFSLKFGMVFEYEVTLALDTADQIRAVFKTLHQRVAVHR